MAQIAAEVRRSFIRRPNSVKVKDFLFGQEGDALDPTEKSKHTWAAALNVNIDRN